MGRRGASVYGFRAAHTREGDELDNELLLSEDEAVIYFLHRISRVSGYF